MGKTGEERPIDMDGWNGRNVTVIEQRTVPQEYKETRDKKGWSRYYITVEPVKFCIGFTTAFTIGVMIDLLQRNVCYHNYNMTFAECTSPNISTVIKADVEAKTALVHMTNNIIMGICPLILVLFIGPWSDANGRKPFIIWSLRGYVVYFVLWGVFSFFPRLPVLWFFVPSVPFGLTGGLIAFSVCTWSYTSENFDPEERTMRFSISNAATVAGGLIGNALADKVLYWGGEYGFQIVFFISFLVALFALLYSTYILEETIVLQEKKGKLFDIKHVKSIVDAIILKPAKGRLLMACILMILLSEAPVNAGDENIAYLVGKSQYTWTLGRYNLYAALSSIISGLGPVAAVWILMDLLRLNNPTLLIIASGALLFLSLAKALAINEEMFWVVSLLVKCSNFIGPAIDTELVDTVSESNVGKAFTFTSLMDALSPVLAIPMYTQLYTHLLPDRTLYVFFLSFGLTIVTLGGAVGLVIQRRSVYTQAPTEVPADENQITKDTEITPAVA